MGHRLVDRPRLLERLSRTPLGGVALVCGPPGSGKSVLLQSWVEAERLGDRVAWVSVERGERDGQRFLLAIIDELAQAIVGERTVERVSPAPDLSARAVVERLLIRLQALDHPVLLVIDDLHELEAPDGLECLELLLQRVPAMVRVALGTQVAPPGLHRVRLTGMLTEIQGRHLRFSVRETRELLEDAGIAISDSAVALLHERTEGWAAGIRLAALALADHPDPERFVSEFSGRDRTVADYLCAEVLSRRRPEVRDLLLRTSVLERVSGSLADALTGGSASEAILQCLEDYNSFVMALDAKRTWFRYHHLFADLLRLELGRSSPTIVGPLHRAAALWLEEHRHILEAIRHAQAGDDWPHAARLLADHFLDLGLDGRAATLTALLAAFPAEVRAADPELAVASTGASIITARFDDAEVYLRYAEALATEVPPARRRRFDLRLAAIRLWLACWRADLEAVSGAMRSLRAALAGPTPYELALDHDVHAMALFNLGSAELWASRPEDAVRDLREALALARRIPRPYLEIGCLAHLGVALVLTGSPFAVMEQLADDAVSIGESNGWGDHPVLGRALAARGTAHVWLGRFDEAGCSFDRAERSLRDEREPGLIFLLRFGRGLMHFAQGRVADAVVEFNAARAAQSIMASEHTLSVELHSRLVQAHATLGDITAARACLDATAPQVRERAIIRVAEATVLLAEGDPDAAIDVLAPALEALPRDAGARGRAVDARAVEAAVEALLCDAVARERLGDEGAAEAALNRALALASPQRLVLPFVLPPARDLVVDHVRRCTTASPLVAAILEVIAGSSPRHGDDTAATEDLSPAELRVLSYLPSGLNAGQIAAELYVSPNTVRTHVRHIYAKLGAHNRGQAVARARELGLLVGR